MPTTITPAELERALALRDLSDPDRGPHAMQLLAGAIAEALERAWSCPVRTYRAGPVVTVEANYGVLGYPADAPAREARYSRYVDADHMLRAAHDGHGARGSARARGRPRRRRRLPRPRLPPRRRRPPPRR